MKLIRKIALGLFCVGFVAYSCDDILDVDYDGVLLEENHQLNSLNDTIYSMVGIFKQLEELAEPYVVLGELRGDLLEITENSSQALQEIYDFDISEGNPYVGVKKYYAVINHCNYLINTIDTSIVAKGEKVMYKEFAAAKAIRAWTYLQIALNYGVVTYYEQPITSLQVAQEDYPDYTLEELLPHLIEDLLPWQAVALPGGISLGDDIVSSEKLFFPVRFVLGDLYLYQGNYEAAAKAYYDLMYDQSYLSTDFFKSEWTIVNGEFVSTLNFWRSMFYLTSSEQITLIAGSSEFGDESKLDSLFLYDYELAPTNVAINNWESQTYYQNSANFKLGDLRGDQSSFYEDGFYSQYYDNVTGPVTTKLTGMSTQDSWAVCIYRTGLLYLRYAEAVNRAGKPNLAFAVLKNGLTANTLAVDSIVPDYEKGAVLPTYMDFADVKFNRYENSNSINIIGIHGRGNGNIQFAKDYKIPSLANLADSILYVEDKIVEELALETAFEGNRFHDLIRIAKRRNDPYYLAKKVAKKYTNADVIEAKLSQEKNWYLPLN
ncbi:hypothetical protein ACT3CD_00440 [Geofilum sp. OHC36d9]|uniref:hypothetical protein n=1 Tax=Geofilum sp. OHC36d9 TaxID=3458413 RepID=UPI0040342963